MNEREQAVFADIARNTELILNEDLLLDCALQDKDLNDFIEEYRVFRGDLVRRMAMIAGGDWAEESHYQDRYEIALDAVRLRYQLTEQQIKKVMIRATQKVRS